MLIRKDCAITETVASNYRVIACLLLMWKLLTGILPEKLYGVQGNTVEPRLSGLFD